MSLWLILIIVLYSLFSGWACWLLGYRFRPCHCSRSDRYAGLIASLLLFFWVRLLQWGYSDFGLGLNIVAEALTEFVLIPFCAACLACLLVPVQGS